MLCPLHAATCALLISVAVKPWDVRPGCPNSSCHSWCSCAKGPHCGNIALPHQLQGQMDGACCGCELRRKDRCRSCWECTSSGVQNHAQQTCGVLTRSPVPPMPARLLLWASLCTPFCRMSLLVNRFHSRSWDPVQPVQELTMMRPIWHLCSSAQAAVPLATA